MRYILDSCALIDIAVAAPTLTKDAVAAYQNTDNPIYISVASIWELGLKRSLGKLAFDINGAIDLLSNNGIKILDITLPITLLVNELPYHHKDPFDRIIIATAKTHDTAIITSDQVFAKYGMEMINSRI